MERVCIKKNQGHKSLPNQQHGRDKPELENHDRQQPGRGRRRRRRRLIIPSCGIGIWLDCICAQVALITPHTNMHVHWEAKLAFLFFFFFPHSTYQWQPAKHWIIPPHRPESCPKNLQTFHKHHQKTAAGTDGGRENDGNPTLHELQGEDRQ